MVNVNLQLSKIDLLAQIEQLEADGKGNLFEHQVLMVELNKLYGESK